MKLKESSLRRTIRKILMSELFVTPAQKRKLKDKGIGSSLKKALDMRPSGGFYSDDPRGFGEFEDPHMHGDRDELSREDDHSELEDPRLDYDDMPAAPRGWGHARRR